MGLLLRNRDLALLLTTWGIWVAADWALLVTVSVVALQLDGPAAVGLVGAVRVLPSALLTGPLSVLTDRWSRGRLLALVYAGWALLALLLAAAVSGEAPLGVLLVGVGAGSVLASMVRPTLQAAVPALVHTPQELVGANSAYATVEGLGTVLGPALCGAGLATVGGAGVLVGVAALFVAGTVAAASIRTPHQPAVVLESEGRDWLAPLRGFAVLAGRHVRLLIALSVGQTTMRGLLNVFVVLVATSLGGDPEAVSSTLFEAMGIGGLLGASVGAALRGSRHGTGWMALGLSLWGLPIAALGVWTSTPTALLALGAVGLGNAVWDVFCYSLFNRLFPDHLAGRAWGAKHALGAAGVALGSMLAPILSSTLGLSTAMVVSGALLAVAPWTAWPWLVRVGHRATGSPEVVDLFRRVPLLAPMSLIGLERLARSAVPVAVPAGRAVVIEDEPADCFYVVESGAVEVSQAGSPVRALGPATCFGEVGLLEHGRRTATVVATEPSHLLRLDGDDFVAAVTGHRPTHAEVRRTVEGHYAADEDRREAPERLQ